MGTHEEMTGSRLALIKPAVGGCIQKPWQSTEIDPFQVRTLCT